MIQRAIRRFILNWMGKRYTRADHGGIANQLLTTRGRADDE